MNPDKVQRECCHQLTDLPNVGPAMAADLQTLGIFHPNDLITANPFELYTRLCVQTGQTHDPCVLDVFLSITAFMKGEPPRPWWAFTADRKQALARADPSLP